MLTVKNRHFFVAQFNLASDVCQQVAQLYPAFRFHGGSQYFAHLSLQCTAVLRRPNPDGTMHLFRHIPDRYCSHVCNLLLIAVKSIIRTAFKYIKDYQAHPSCWFGASFLALNSACSLALRRASSLGALFGDVFNHRRMARFRLALGRQGVAFQTLGHLSARQGGQFLAVALPGPLLEPVGPLATLAGGLRKAVLVP